MLEVRLIKTPVTITPDTLLSSLEECDYNGYNGPLSSGAWIGPAVSSNGDETITSPIFVFTHGSTPDLGIAYSYIITITIGLVRHMIAGENFPAPYPMQNALQQVPVPIVLALRSLAA